MLLSSVRVSIVIDASEGYYGSISDQVFDVKLHRSFKKRIFAVANSDEQCFIPQASRRGMHRVARGALRSAQGKSIIPP